jgi:hypothetical protein
MRIGYRPRSIPLMPRHESKTVAAKRTTRMIANRKRKAPAPAHSTAATTTSAATATHQTPPNPPISVPKPPQSASFGALPALPLAVQIRLNRVKPSTQAQYLSALAIFDRAAHEMKLPTPQSAEELDGQLEAFAERVFAAKGGVGRQTVCCARLACIWLNPALRNLLPRSRAVSDLSAWNRAAGRSVQRHPPLTWPITCLLAHWLMRDGDTATAIAAVTSFDCALRIHEAADLRISDVREISAVDARLLRVGAPELVIAVRNPKTGLHNTEQSVFVLNRAVTALLREWIAIRRAAGARDGDSLFGRTCSQLHYQLARVVAPLGATAHFTWHSLRHGATTLLFMAGWSTTEVMHHGRWLSERSAWRYQQAGRAGAAAHGVAPALIEEGERISTALGSALTKPTASPEI